MPLRSQTSCRPKPAPRAAPPRVAITVACLALLALAFLAGRADAGTGDYASPLYFSRIAAPALAGAHELVTSPGTGTPTAAPTTTAVAGAGIPTGFYRYVYTVVDPNGSETEPSPVSLPDVQTTAGMQNVLVGGLPTGVTVRLYRRKSSTILFYRVVELANNVSATYTDSAGEPPPGAVVLPQAQNRVAWVFMNPYSCTASNCGYEEFRPGIPVPNAGTSFPTSPPAASPTPTGNGWIVQDDTGNVAFAGGDWTFRVHVKSGPMASGTAHLVVGMWKVTASGPTYSSPLIDPGGAGEETATNLIDTSNSFRPITHTVSVPAFTLVPGERLYVQFWRKQTAPYQSASANDARVITLTAQDGDARIEHQGVSTLPATPTPTSPADGAVMTSTSPLLAATFSDPDALDTGTVDFRVCTVLVGGQGSDCSDEAAAGSSATVANGASATWTVSPALAPGLYYWQARANDGIGTSGWSATRAFTVHEPPGAPTLVSPAAGAQVRTATPRLKASFTDPDGDDGLVHFRVCRTASPAGQQCSSAVVAGSSVTVASGTTTSWTVASQLADRRYYWQAQSEDEHGEVSAWTATRRLYVAKHLIRILSEDSLVCSVGARLPARIKLAARASVTVLFHIGDRVDLVHSYGKLDAGTTTLRKFLSYDLARPAVYRVEWRAQRSGERESDWMRVKLKPLPRSGGPYCRPAS
jgi:hypothetical protein